MRLLGERVLDIKVGEWTELYVKDASRPACLVITEIC
jgi:hypothetical protein